MGEKKLIEEKDQSNLDEVLKTLPDTIIDGKIIEDITISQQSEDLPNLDDIQQSIEEEHYKENPYDIQRNEWSDNGDSLAETPGEDFEKAKKTFISELIKKVSDPEPIQDIVSSPAQPKSASHYARRHVAPLREKVANVLAQKVTNLDAINIEERGVYKCHPDKPIRN